MVRASRSASSLAWLALGRLGALATAQAWCKNAVLWQPSCKARAAMWWHGGPVPTKTWQSWEHQYRSPWTLGESRALAPASITCAAHRPTTCAERLSPSAGRQRIRTWSSTPRARCARRALEPQTRRAPHCRRSASGTYAASGQHAVLVASCTGSWQSSLVLGVQRAIRSKYSSFFGLPPRPITDLPILAR